MSTAMEHAKENNSVSGNPAKSVTLSKKIQNKTKFRVEHIDEAETLNLEQIKFLLEKSKDIPLHPL